MAVSVSSFRAVLKGHLLKGAFSSPQVTFIMVSLSFSVVLNPFICLLVYLYVYDLARSLPHS